MRDDFVHVQIKFLQLLWNEPRTALYDQPGVTCTSVQYSPETRHSPTPLSNKFFPPAEFQKLVESVTRVTVQNLTKTSLLFLSFVCISEWHHSSLILGEKACSSPNYY